MTGLIQVQGGQGGPGEQPGQPPACQPRQEQEAKVPQGCPGGSAKGTRIERK